MIFIQDMLTMCYVNPISCLFIGSAPLLPFPGNLSPGDTGCREWLQVATRHLARDARDDSRRRRDSP